MLNHPLVKPKVSEVTGDVFFGQSLVVWRDNQIERRALKGDLGDGREIDIKIIKYGGKTQQINNLLPSPDYCSYRFSWGPEQNSPLEESIKVEQRSKYLTQTRVSVAEGESLTGDYGSPCTC